MKKIISGIYFFGVGIYFITAVLMSYIFYKSIYGMIISFNSYSSKAVLIINISTILIAMIFIAAYLIFSIVCFKKQKKLILIIISIVWLPINMMLFYIIPPQIFLIPLYLLIKQLPSFIFFTILFLARFGLATASIFILIALIYYLKIGMKFQGEHNETTYN